MTLLKLLIHGGRVVDPSQDLDGRFDVLIEDGAISKIDEKIAKPKGAETIDAVGLNHTIDSTIELE